MQVTVKDLAEYLNELVKAGMGNKKVVVADDNEGNAYHGMFYCGCHEPQQVKENIEFSNGLYDSQETNPNNLVIIG